MLTNRRRSVYLRKCLFICKLNSLFLMHHCYRVIGTSRWKSHHFLGINSLPGSANLYHLYRYFSECMLLCPTRAFLLSAASVVLCAIRLTSIIWQLAIIGESDKTGIHYLDGDNSYAETNVRFFRRRKPDLPVHGF